MKIIYIANLRLPTEKAHGLQIMKMCESFAKQGNELELIIPRRANQIKKDPFEYYGVARIFKIRKISCLDLITLDKYIGHLGLWIESVSFNIFAAPRIFLKKSDIIYTRDKFFLPFSLFKKNLIFEIHTFPQNYFLYHLFFKKITGITVITQKLKELLMKQGISSDKILVAPDGVDLEEFDTKKSREECREILNLSQGKKIILYTGHLYQWKGTGVLLEAARKLPIDNYQFIFVGGTKEDIVEFEKQAGGVGNVLVVGHRSHKEIPYWLKSADVLVLPNSGKEDISKLWTSPMKMFEYMASRRPIVASSLPSLREVLNENNSVLVEPDNPEKLAAAIKKILENPQLAEKISDQAFMEVQDYTWEKRVKKIFEFLSSKNS